MKKLILIFGFHFALAAEALPTEFSKDLNTFQQSNVFLNAQKGKLTAAEDAHLSKMLFWTPTLSLSAGKTRSEIKGTPAVDSDFWRANANLNLFRGGADWAEMNQAGAAENAQGFAVKNEELRVEQLAAELIFKNLYQKESLRLQESLYKLKEETLKIVKDRYRDGRTPLQEVSKYEVDLGQQKNRFRLASLDLQENEMAIQTAFVTSVSSTAWPFGAGEEIRLEDKKIRNDPLVEQKYWNLKSAEAGWKAASRSHWPTLDVAVQYQESPFNEPTVKETYSAVTLTLPLWSRYETAASSSQAYAGFLSADAEYRSADRANLLKRNFLGKKIEIVRQNLVESKNNLDKSKDLYKDILRAFKLGKVSTNDLLTEQSRLLESESNLINAQLSFHQTVVESCILQGLKIRECVN